MDTLTKKYIQFKFICFSYGLCILFIPLINFLRFVASDNNYPPLTRFVRFPTLIFFLLFFIIYFIFIHLRKTYFRSTNWPIYGSIVILLGLYSCAVYPIFSIDLFEYIFRGRIASVYGSNPYIIAPTNFPNDIFYPLIFWKTNPTIYGPLWSWLEYVPTKLAGSSISLNIFLMKSELFIFYLLSAYQIYQIANTLKLKNPFLISEIFILNPYMIIMTLIDGHNDIVLLFFLLWSLSELIKKRNVAALLLLTFATLVKYITIILFPFYLVMIIHQKISWNNKIMNILKGFIISLLATFILCKPFWTGKNIFQSLLEVTSRFRDNTIAYLIYRIMHLALPSMTGALFMNLSRAIFWIIIAIISVWLFKKRDDQKAIINAIFFSFIAFLIIGSFQFGQWYLIWIAPLILLIDLRFNFLLFMIFTFSALISFWKRFPSLIIIFMIIYLFILCICSKRQKLKILLEKMLQFN